MHAQKQLRDVLGLQIIRKNQEPHPDVSFVVVFPPCFCCETERCFRIERYAVCRNCGLGDDYRKSHGYRCPLHDGKEKPVICSDNSSDDSEEYIEMFSALKILNLLMKLDKVKIPV